MNMFEDALMKDVQFNAAAIDCSAQVKLSPAKEEEGDGWWWFIVLMYETMEILLIWLSWGWGGEKTESNKEMPAHYR